VTRLRTYGQYRPTAFDPAGAFLSSDDPEEDRSPWLVGPCGLNRDSCSLDKANWRALRASLERVDPDGADHEVHRFGHWACGWFEIIIARPGSAAADDMEESARALDNYPVLDDEMLVEEEREDEDRSWRVYAREFRRALERALASDLGMSDEQAETALEDVTDDDLRGLAERISPYGWEHTNEGATLDVERAAANVTREDLDTLPGLAWPAPEVGG
jgi:hypothetical protein